MTETLRRMLPVFELHWEGRDGRNSTENVTSVWITLGRGSDDSNSTENATSV